MEPGRLFAWGLGSRLGCMTMRSQSGGSEAFRVPRLPCLDLLLCSLGLLGLSCAPSPQHPKRHFAEHLAKTQWESEAKRGPEPSLGLLAPPPQPWADEEPDRRPCATADVLYIFDHFACLHALPGLGCRRKRRESHQAQADDWNSCSLQPEGSSSIEVAASGPFFSFWHKVWRHSQSQSYTCDAVNG